MKEKRYLLHVGYPKAGSSLIGDWLERNPFFGFQDFTVGGLADTNALIALSKQPAEAQPLYAVVRDMLFTIQRVEALDLTDLGSIKRYQQQVCDTLRSYFPQGKVLIVTRGYQSMISANYSQYIKEGGTHKTEDIFKFGVVLKELFDYSFLVRIYCEAFGKENVIVLPYELLRANPETFFTHIETALDVPHYPFSAKVVNPSLNHREAVQLRKMNSLVDLLSRHTGTFGKRLKERYVQQRRRKAFEWDTNALPAVQSERKTPLVEVAPELLELFKGNSTLLAEYPIFENYLSFYAIS